MGDYGNFFGGADGEAMWDRMRGLAGRRRGRGIAVEAHAGSLGSRCGERTAGVAGGRMCDGPSAEGGYRRHSEPAERRIGCAGECGDGLDVDLHRCGQRAWRGGEWVSSSAAGAAVVWADVAHGGCGGWVCVDPVDGVAWVAISDWKLRSRFGRIRGEHREFCERRRSRWLRRRGRLLL